MDIIKRNTDYALRILSELVNGPNRQRILSARHLSDVLHIPYPITCKLLQKLQDHEITASIMGPKGGYTLARPPAQISFLEVIEAIQGPIHMNRCFFSHFQCPLKERCPLREKLGKIHDDILLSLKTTTLEEIRDKRLNQTGE